VGVPVSIRWFVGLAFDRAEEFAERVE